MNLLAKNDCTEAWFTSCHYRNFSGNECFTYNLRE